MTDWIPAGKDGLLRDGRRDYEADVAKQPRYHDGSPRKAWDQLSEIARWSWNRP